MPSVDINTLLGEVLATQRTGGGASIIEAPLALRQAISGGYTYIGEAVPGTLDADEAWRILRLDSSGTIEWANGSGSFSVAWDDGAGTDYSTHTYS